MRAREFNIISEIKMSPAVLARMASRIKANAGMEFEMIVPVGNDALRVIHDPTVGNYAPSNIDEIVAFFSEYVDAYQLASQLHKEYREWQNDVVGAAWDYAATRAIAKHMLQKTGQSMTDELAAEIEDIVNNPQSPEHQAAYELWLKNNRSSILEAYTQSDWLYRMGVENMYRASIVFGIPWHYDTVTINKDAIADIAKTFGQAVSRPYNWSDRYHGAPREPGKYAVEPDGSLEPDNKKKELGLEFVSPTLPVDQLLGDLQKVKQWADQNGAYTNHSTGLHINVSLPNRDWNNLDYVKLILLSGDDYVAERFGRYGNHYCNSVREQLSARVERQPEKAQRLLELMKDHLNQTAYKMLHSGETEHDDGINVKDGYIEFRSAGDDWLGDKFNLIVETLNRYVVALDIAMDPDRARDEYQRKLYKLLSPSIEGDDIISLFVDYSANPEKLPKLKREISNIRNRKKWEVAYAHDSNTKGIVYAPDEISAILAWYKDHRGVDLTNSKKAWEQAERTRDQYIIKLLK